MRYDRSKPRYSNDIRERRMQTGMTLKAMARRLGLHPGNLGEIELGHRKLKPEIAARIETLLAPKVSPWRLAHDNQHRLISTEAVEIGGKAKLRLTIEVDLEHAIDLIPRRDAQ